LYSQKKKKKYPQITVDALIPLDHESLVLIKRKNPPYKDHWAIPGGFVELGETLEYAVMREAKEETGLDVEPIKIINIYSDPLRDPRGHTITVAFFCKKIGGSLKADSDAKEIKVFSKKSIKNIKLAFDHQKILTDFFKFFNEE